MSTPAAPLPNPYVGPRAFEEGEGERFFGRDRELMKLLNLLIARRLVLLYAPSGAGKTSLIQAALVLRLRAEGFVVHRPVRAGVEVPPDTAGLAYNRYILATLLTLDEQLPPARRLPPAELAQTRLADYLERGGEQTDEVLIFDQFEELLTTDPADRAAKQEFLAQLGAALENPRRWALFAIREDFLGSIRPLLVPLPTRLDALFRLDLLDPVQAQRAMQQPARAAGVVFSDAAAQQLTNDLRRTMVQRPDGTSEAVLGETIEPVQLQVVCYRLWQRLFSGGEQRGTIEAVDVEQAGNVDDALRSYYAERVAAIAAATGIHERHIRDWVEERLITEAGLRGQVLREPQATGGLSNEAIRRLVDAHLVRGEERRGATWFELAHDRLVAPIRADNAAWQAANLTPLQRQAALWDEQRRPDGLLLRGETLAQAEAGIDEAGLSKAERAFLAESRAARAAEQREQRQARRIRLLAWVASLVGAIALIVAGIAVALYQRSEQALDDAESSARQAQTAQAGALRQADLAATAQADSERAAQVAQTAQAIAEEQNRVSLSRQVAFQSLNLRASQPDLAALLAVEGVALNQNSATLDSLFDLLEESLPVVEVRGSAALRASSAARAGDSGIGYTAVSRDGQRVAFWFFTGEIQVWDVGGARPRDRFQVQLALFPSFSFSSDGRLLAIATGLNSSSSALVRDVERGQTIAERPLESGFPSSVAFGPGDSLVAIGGAPTLLWDWRGDAMRTLANDQTQRVAYSPDGQLLAVSSDTRVTLIDVQSENSRVLEPELPARSRSRMAFSPDGRLVAAGSFDKIYLWEVQTGNLIAQLDGNTGGAPLVLAFSPDGRALALGNFSGNVVFWQAARPDEDRPLDIVSAWTAAAQRPGSVYRQHVGLVYGLAARADGRFVSASTEGAIMVWDFAAEHVLRREAQEDELPSDLAAGRLDPNLPFAITPDGRTEVYGADGILRATLPISASVVALSPDETTIVAGEPLGPIALFDRRSATPRGITWQPPRNDLATLRYSADGTTLAAIFVGHITLLEAATLRPHTEIDTPNLQLDVATLTPHTVKFAARVCLRKIGQPFGTQGCEGYKLLVYDAAQASEFDIADSEATPLGFSADGRTLFTEWTGYYAWDLDPAHWIERGCAIANRNMSIDEWRRLVSPTEPYRLTCPAAVDGGLGAEALARDQQLDAALALAGSSAARPEWTAQTWAALCATGAFAGRSADVLFACDEAITLAPDDPGWRDTRGLARALAGDQPGAIEDFTAFIAQTSDAAAKLERQGWVEALRRGVSPFDQATLDRLRTSQFN